MRLEHYSIECYHCKRQFPKVLKVETGNKGADSFEIECPLCEKDITVHLPKGDTLGNDASVLRGM